MSKRRNWSLVGVPDHLGVLNVGGRIGAALGPGAFRKVFDDLKGQFEVQTSRKDFGNVELDPQDLPRNLRLAADRVRDAQAATGISVVVGGGHDHGYSHLLGIREALAKGKKGKLRLGCINLDAHLDTRKPDPVITSGSPFYLAIDGGVLEGKNLVEFGIQNHCNSPVLWDFVKKNKVQVVPMTRLRNGVAAREFAKALKKLKASCDAIVISLDLDSAASAYAPGVSAPQAEGFSAGEIIEIMEIAGAEKKTASLGIFELNPVHDTDGRTALLAATAAYHFVASALSR